MELELMDELKEFQQIHGIPLAVGMEVKVNNDAPYADEWQGIYVVVGIQWVHRHGKINVTIAESIGDGGSDGWKPGELTPVVPPPTFLQQVNAAMARK